MLIDLAKMAKIQKFHLANSLLDSTMATWLTLTVTLGSVRYCCMFEILSGLEIHGSNGSKFYHVFSFATGMLMW